MPSRQLHLGASKTGFLEIVDLPRPGSPFDILPDELLLAIVEFAARNDGYSYSNCCSGGRDYPTIVALTKVCRRLNGLATPFLYNWVDFNFSSTLDYNSLHHRALLPRRQDCRQLNITLNYPRLLQEEHVIAAMDFFTGFNRVRCLIIEEGFNDWRHSATWELIDEVLMHMPDLKHFTLRKNIRSRLYPNLLLSSLMKNTTVSRLETLKFSGEGNWGLTQRLANRDKMATLRNLNLQNFDKDGGSIERLIRWSKQLRSFSLSHSFCDDKQDYMDLTMLGTWLSSQTETLEEIDIGILSSSASGKIFDLSQYRALKFLRLSRYSFSPDLESCESDANLILSPGLQDFCWNFMRPSPHSAPRGDEFGEKEEQWLQKFVDIAVSKSSPLKTIFLDFDVEFHNWWTWPSGHLTRLNEYCRQFGITLHYKEPYFEPRIESEWMRTRPAEPHEYGVRDIREYFLPLSCTSHNTL
ncbi:hypothetical protein F5Y00DRAFT_235851 [Daldinia vernicosa]|uniref:uncharacterized protein n=1 Tax=Daldinia vernicosa TaxID=114800 RepID=UPI002007E0C7|nr:uncharacterized protein F5Y00DRAFT_235851 [Daldinia vernicosa]KAI0849518.1 hypothetical protein F5Y00DRAFT_235851 [Daldinia vernicosa]